MTRQGRDDDATEGERPLAHASRRNGHAARTRSRLARLIDPRRATGRLLAAVLAGLVAATLVPAPCAFGLRGVVGWDLGALVMLALAWNVILRSPAERTRARAVVDDLGPSLVWMLAVGSSVFSLFAAIFVIRRANNMLPGGHALWTGFGIAAVVLSWLLTHTSYALRYARLHYRRVEPNGLAFPGSEPPSDIDFAYFAFGIGMCFQVGDVAVTCTRIRRTVLGHALLSFVQNTVVVALTLNLLFGFLGTG